MLIDEVVKAVCEAQGHKASVRTAARLLGTDRQIIYSWMDKETVPPKWMLLVEELSNGKIRSDRLLRLWSEKNPPASDRVA